MGTVFKETSTKPLPNGAKIIVRKGQRLAEWHRRQRETPDGARHRREGRHRPIGLPPGPTPPSIGTARGSVREVATGCRDESAADSVLDRLGTAGRTGER